MLNIYSVHLVYAVYVTCFRVMVFCNKCPLSILTQVFVSYFGFLTSESCTISCWRTNHIFPCLCILQYIRQVGERYTWRAIYRDKDILFYLSYYHCLQTVKKSNLQDNKCKGTQMCYDLIDSRKSLPWRHWHSRLNTQWVSNDSLSDMNTITTH